MSTRAAREQAQIAVELASPEETGAVRALAAGIHRLADLLDFLDDQREAWARETVQLRGLVDAHGPVER